MAWVTAIREVRVVTVAANPDLVGFRKGPVMTRTRRVVREVPRASWASLMHFRVTLPAHRGAGPCGTDARRECRPGVLKWSRVYLLAPLAAYYSSYVPPMRFGAKPGPRGRRAA